jgi:D-glycerate 3-kinase
VSVRQSEIPGTILTIPYSDAEDPLYVYDWRQQQESAMRAIKGTGMSEEQVNNFVNGCTHSRPINKESWLTTADYPAYELYTEVLRNGIYPEPGRQLRLIVGKDRRVKDVVRL